MSGGLSLSHLRATAVLCGVDPTDADLLRAREYLADLIPAFAELERLIAADTVPDDRSPSRQP
jgi:hypothetical protein